MRLEKDISKDVAKKLSTWQFTGEIIWWLRINSGKIRTEWGSYVQLAPQGTPDYVAIVRNKSLGISVVFIECKSDTGVLRKDQKLFKDSMIGQKDVYYLVVRELLDLMLIMDISFTKEIEF